MEPTPLWNFLEALLPNDPAEDARPEWLGLADPQRGQGFPPAQRARMVAVARRRRASAPQRVARARRQVEDFHARRDDGARAELATDSAPSTLP
ncbi:MAG: hypothetical protein IT457_15495, partial [Planctomycetes bacterium]|nr:hypothetical protein [Planctomycetota bacterium]